MEFSQIFGINSDEQFAQLAIETFNQQFCHVKVYHDYVSLLGINPNNVKTIEQIPFLPIQFFKTHTVIAENQNPQITFTSSGTTGSETSKHHVSNLSIYEESFTRGFKHFYGNPSDYCILALLPAYLERTGSSLIYMADSLIKQSGNKHSGFYLNQYDQLAQTMKQFDAEGQKCLLLGVSFALLDMTEKFQLNLQNTTIMETGGMKGRRKEILREELHATLCKSFGVEAIHSEYGMTELLSQAYSKGNGIFACPPWMRVLIRETSDPLSVHISGNGAINIIDLANQNSCAFIQTEDAGRAFANRTFSVQGRMENAPMRGCNLLVF